MLIHLDKFTLNDEFIGLIDYEQSIVYLKNGREIQLTDSEIEKLKVKAGYFGQITIPPTSQNKTEE